MWLSCLSTSRLELRFPFRSLVMFLSFYPSVPPPPPERNLVWNLYHVTCEMTRWPTGRITPETLSTRVVVLSIARTVILT